MATEVIKKPFLSIDSMITAYCDGACSGNPGPMGIGVVFWKNGERINEISEFIGKGTNNIAEYNAVIRALQEAKKLGQKEVIIRSDSQLLIKQLNREYKVKEHHLKPLKLKIDELCLEVRVKFEHIERERNKRADYLSKKAIDNILTYNAYILERTINNYSELKEKLKQASFIFINEGNNIRVKVPFSRIEEFYNLARPYLNAPYNYIDAQFPKEKKTAIIFSEIVIYITNRHENENAKKWAISKGLPEKEADWKTSY